MLDIAPWSTKKEAYASAMSEFPDYLRYLEPVVTGKHLHVVTTSARPSPGARLNYPNISEAEILRQRAVYCGVMVHALLAHKAAESLYPVLDFAELTVLWFEQSTHPVESLKDEGFLNSANRYGLDLLLRRFLELQIMPAVTSTPKVTANLKFFESQFFGGVLLGCIASSLAERDSLSTHHHRNVQSA